ncbi:Hypothetical predicted protein, partial [Paramuricea clavata]
IPGISGIPGNPARDGIPGSRGPAGAKGEPGERGYDYVDLVKSNWKQCVWKRRDNKDFMYLSNSSNTRKRTLPVFQSPDCESAFLKRIASDPYYSNVQVF